MAYNNEWTEERTEYMRELSFEYGVPFSVVRALADMLGPNEDYDGLVTELEDMAVYADMTEFFV